MTKDELQLISSLLRDGHERIDTKLDKLSDEVHQISASVILSVEKIKNNAANIEKLQNKIDTSQLQTAEKQFNDSERAAPKPIDSAASTIMPINKGHIAILATAVASVITFVTYVVSALNQ